jgi:Flp pilus assembly protein TadG
MSGATKKKVMELRDQEGVTLILVAGLTVMFVAFIALSVDIAHLYAVRNELHNAADAGALAGARCLYDCYADPAIQPGSIVNTDANNVADAAARDNKSERVEVEVNSPTTNADDVQRGHWRFASQEFRPSNNTTPPDLWNATSQQLDDDWDFVNAVRVITRRESTQADSFFARILGYVGFNVVGEAVAYLGFAGTLAPKEVDQPIAICRDVLRDPDTDEYTCNVGRLINSSGALPTMETGGFTNFIQDPDPVNTSCGDSDACSGAASVPTITPLVCSGGNPVQLTFGAPVKTTNGLTSNFNRLECCWKDAPITCNPKTTAPPTAPVIWTLPVVDCDSCHDNNISPCSKLVGAVTVRILWINGSGVKNDPDTYAPYQMGDWTAPAGASGIVRWDSFVADYNLHLTRTDLATYANGGFQDNTIYFAPDCEYHEPVGSSGGANYGILAKRPVIVQ